MTEVTLKIGDSLPNENLYIKTASGIEVIEVNELVENKKVVLFSVPGAFTPTCSAAHLPGYVATYDQFVDAGVDHVICVSVNDPHVMAAWSEQQNAENLLLLSDGNGALAEAMGMELDAKAAGMGIRSKRYSMLLENGVIKQLNLEAPGKFEVSDAETLLKQMAG